MTNIDRFKQAQKESYARAYQEINAGRKQSHWIWYIFPQLEILGYSPTAKRFGIVDFKEACIYLQDAELFKNYYDISLLVLKKLKKSSIVALMGGELDAKKLTSSITLFHEAASFLLNKNNTSQDFAGLVRCCNDIFLELAKEGYFPCEATLNFVKSEL